MSEIRQNYRDRAFNAKMESTEKMDTATTKFLTSISNKEVENEKSQILKYSKIMNLHMILLPTMITQKNRIKIYFVKIYFVKINFKLNSY